ncbi:MAG: fatty acid desaturase [Bacteroidetes bacterium]|nr:fatty acid desaturase [Bacteroidota bacterium]
MLEGKQLILATQKYAVEDRAKSWMHLVITMLTFVLLYTSILMPIPLWVKLIISIFIGLNLVRMFVIYHDYLHKAILQKSILAEVIFTIFGMYILAPQSIWRRSHDYHHKHNSKLYTSSVGSFPIVTKEKFESSSAKDKSIYLFVRSPFVISMGYFFAFMYGMCIQSFASSKEKHWDTIPALLFHFTIGAAFWYFFGVKIFLLGFLFPALISSALGTYLFYAQHNFPRVSFMDKDGWTYSDAALESSSFMKMNFIMRWFTANIGYHHIHHINARIPFYRLPEVLAAMPEFQHPKVTSLGLMDIYKCLRLKVWDVEKREMVGV